MLVVFNSYQVFARESVVLSGEEIRQFLSNRTMVVSELEPDQTTGSPYSFNAYFSDFGEIRAIRSDGKTSALGWEIDDNGTMCIRNYTRYRGRLCGFVVVNRDAGFTVKKQEDVYEFYINNRGNTSAITKSGKVVFDPKWRHYLTFSDIQEGEKL